MILPTTLGKLMQDFFCNDPHKMNNKVLSDRTVHFKQSKEGFDSMCKIVDDYAKKQAAEQVKEARIETAKAKSRAFALKLWKKGYRDLNEIAEMSELPIEKVKEMFKGESA